MRYFRRGEPCASEATASRDIGATFTELLVAIVLIGLVVTGVLTALTVSIRGSDQHRSKVSALAELEGAAAHLNRVFNDDLTIDCPWATPADQTVALTAINTELTSAFATGGPLDDPNEGVSVSAGPLTCVNDVALVTLTSDHVRQNASESLQVTVGGVTVLENGNMGVSPAPGACTWGTADIDQPNPELKPSGRLNTTVTVTLPYTGDCTGEMVNLEVVNISPAPVYPPTIEAMALSGNALSGEFEFTFAKNYYSPWQVGPVNLELTTSPTVGTFPTSFTVLP